MAARRAPLFTTNLFSTKSFGPGHVVGAAVLVLGTYALARGAIRRTRRAEGARERGNYERSI